MDKALQRLLDFRYADFNDRHVFTTKLRVLIYLGYWVLVIAFFPDLLWARQPIMLWISLTFVVTTICYHFILNERLPYLLFIVELMADIAAHSILIYISGGAASKLFIIYILYCLAGGLIYNWRVSAVIAALAMLFYSVLLIALEVGWLEPFVYEIQGIAWFGQPGYDWLLNLILLTSSLGVAVYGNSIATYFNKQRERALEARNIELMALNRISNTIRVVVNFQRVVDEILHNLTRSLGYRAALMLIVDQVEGRVKVYVENRRLAGEVSDRMGFSIRELHLPIDDEVNCIYQAMKQQRRILRSNLTDIVAGLQPEISPEIAARLQEEFGFRKLIAVPLIAERSLVGALVGLSGKDWLTEDDIAAFERYADQAALVLDNAGLIEKLRNKNIELERVSRVKSEFLATMSHELRTPLTAIIGFSELMLEEVLGDLSTDQKESLSEVLTNAENLLQLINSLLDLAKIEAGRMELNVGPVHLGDIVQRVHRTVAPLLLKKGHRLDVSIPEDLPIFYGDERKVQQTLLNLVSNAIKFTGEKGQISVAVRYYPHIEEVKSWEGIKGGKFRRGAFELSVTDTGIGIAKQDLDYIFDSFRQVDSSFTRNYQGTGLGLGLSQQFVQMHEGVIKAESELGKGSTFYVLLPQGQIAPEQLQA